MPERQEGPQGPGAAVWTDPYAFAQWLIAEARHERDQAQAELGEALRGQYRGPVIYGSEAVKVDADARRYREALERIAELARDMKATDIARAALKDESDA